MFDFVFKNGYYELMGTKLQVIKVSGGDNQWVVVDSAYSVQQSLPSSLEEAKEYAVKMAGKQ
jgi:hypothetical protein